MTLYYYVKIKLLAQVQLNSIPKVFQCLAFIVNSLSFLPCKDKIDDSHTKTTEAVSHRGDGSGAESNYIGVLVGGLICGILWGVVVVMATVYILLSCRRSLA